jgi:hypothetical protein
MDDVGGTDLRDMMGEGNGHVSDLGRRQQQRGGGGSRSMMEMQNGGASVIR